MTKHNLFFDSSALIAGIYSASGAARVLLVLAEIDKIVLTVSEQVIIETEHNLARKMPRILPSAREMILRANIQIVRSPSLDEVKQHHGWMQHETDIPILVAARNAQVDFLVTLNTKHFIEDPQVALRSGLRIGTPGDALTWIRAQLAATPGYQP